MLPQDLGRVVETDVLIIGGGIAGLFAAIKAKEGNPGAKVTLVDKACPGASGCSAFAAGVFLYCQPGDDTEPLVRQIVEDNAEYLIDQDYVRIAAAESYDRFRDLQEFGVEFLKDRRGQITRVPALAAKTGLCSPFGGGPHLMWKMRAEALKRGVVMFDRFMTTDLLTDNGGCIGAVGFGVRDGEFYIFKGRATVLAGGNLLFNAAPMGSSGGTGDGIAIAFRAGLELRNMEQLGNVSVGPKSLSAPGLHVIFGNGGILVNAQGERFMERYNPVLKEEARRFETARAILSEWREGRGPCYLDCTHLPPEAIATIKRSLPLVMSGLAAQGLDIAKDKIEYILFGLSLLHVGGVRIKDADGQVDMKGLWVVGAAGDYCGGADSTVATTLSGSAVQGARAGKRAAEFATNAETREPDIERLRDLKEKTFEPLGKKGGRDPDEAFHRLLENVYRYLNVLKSEGMLKKGLGELESLQGDLTTVRARDPHELRKVHDMKNMALLATISARASLLRTESRRAHYRLDYPQRDDKNWLKWIIAKSVSSELRLWTEDIPIAKWKYKPSLD